MPRKATRSAQGGGTIRKKTVTRRGRPYTSREGRATVGYDPGTGKQIQRSFTGKTQKEVIAKLQEANLQISAGDYFEPSKMTLAQWLDVWVADYMGDKKYLTVKHYRAQVKEHIKPALGAVKLSQLSPHMIQAFYNDLLKRGRTVPKRDASGKIIKKDGKTVTEQAPMSAKSVRNIHGILTKALSVAVNVGYLKANPADRVTLPKVQRREIHPLTDEQIKELLRVADGDEYGLVLKVILFTGLREAEATGLTWDCVDFKAGTVKVCKQLQKRPLADGGATFAPLKNDKTRILKPAPFVMGLLKRRHTEQIRQRVRGQDN